MREKHDLPISVQKDISDAFCTELAQTDILLTSVGKDYKKFERRLELNLYKQFLRKVVLSLMNDVEPEPPKVMLKLPATKSLPLLVSNSVQTEP